MAEEKKQSEILTETKETDETSDKSKSKSKSKNEIQVKPNLLTKFQFLTLLPDSVISQWISIKQITAYTDIKTSTLLQSYTTIGLYFSASWLALSVALPFVSWICARL